MIPIQSLTISLDTLQSLLHTTAWGGIFKMQIIACLSPPKNPSLVSTCCLGGKNPKYWIWLVFHHERLFPELLLCLLLQVSFNSHFTLSINITSLGKLSLTPQTEFCPLVTGSWSIWYFFLCHFSHFQLNSNLCNYLLDICLSSLSKHHEGKDPHSQQPSASHIQTIQHVTVGCTN